MNPLTANLLNRREASRCLNVSIRTLDYQVAVGELPAVKIGKCVRFRPCQIARFIEARERCAPGAIKHNRHRI